MGIGIDGSVHGRVFLSNRLFL